MNVRYGSLVTYHYLHLTVCFQYEAVIHQRLLSSVSGRSAKSIVRY